MTKVFRPKDISFTTNLEEQCLNQIEFLRAVNAVPILKDEQFLKFALYRYETFWLPLARDHIRTCLSAPLDIEWIWHCHMLSPRTYSRDCHTIVGDLINHTIRGPNEYKSKLQKTEKLWKQKYPTVPFQVDLKVPSYPKELETFQSSLTYDVVSSALRQNVFFYQVSLPHYCDTKYLDLCLLRYKQFLYIKQQLQDEFIVPCYDIDIIWHSHQLNPKDYEKDMMKYIGNLFDSVNDISEGSKLDNSHVRTKEYWRKYFNENFSQYGAMYRGQPPDGILYQMSENEMFLLSTRKTTIALNKFVICLDISSHGGQVCLNIEGCANDKVIYNYATLKDCCTSTVTLMGPIFIEFRTNQVNKLRMTLTRKKGLSGTSLLGKCSIDMCEIVEKGLDGELIDIHSKLETHSLHMTGSFTKPERDEILLFLEKGQFESAILPQTVCQLWGPVTLDRLPANMQNVCDVATHRLKNHIGQASLSARVIHSPQLSQAVIQVFRFDKMVTMAHLVTHDHLPLRTQVKRQDIPSIEPQIGERALLIKDRNGDWGIVIGGWRAVKEGIFNTIFHSDARPTTGVLSVRFYKLTTGKMSTFDIGSHFCGHKFRIGPLIADLQSGNIVLDATTNEVPEYLALAFSMALLTALCVPKVAKWTDDRSPYADRMNLVLASGFNLIHSSQRYTGQCSRIFSTPNDNATDVGGRQDDDSLNTYDDIDNAEGLGPSNTRFEGVLEPDPRVTDGAHGTND